MKGEHTLTTIEKRRGIDSMLRDRVRIGIVVLVLALVAAGLASPFFVSSNAPFSGERLALNDLKRLRRGDPVELAGSVIFVDRAAHSFYMQDEVSGLRISASDPLPEVGQRVRIRAIVAREYDARVGLRSVTLDDVEILERRRGELPEPQVVAIADLLRGTQRIEGRRVQTGGVVRAAKREQDRLVLELGDAGQRMTVTVLDASNVDLDTLLDSRVTVRGALQLGLDRIAETFAPHLWVRSTKDFVVISAAPPLGTVRSTQELFSQSRWLREGHRVVLDGTVVRTDADGTLLIDSRGLLLPVEMESVVEYRAGERVRVTGWPTRQRWNVVLERATVVAIEGADIGASEEVPDIALTTISGIRALKAQDAAKNLPIRVAAVVTSVNYIHQFAFVQADSSAIWVDGWGQALDTLVPGQKVEITGITAPGEFAPVIAQPWFKILGTTSMPQPRKVDPEIAPSGAYDSQWVELEGLLRPFSTEDGGNIDFALDSEIGPVGGILITPSDPALLEAYVDAKVRARGVLGTSFTSKGVLTGYRIFVHSVNDMQIISPAPRNQDLNTPRAINQLLRFTASSDASRRVLVRGIVTMRTPGRLFVEDSTGSLQVQAPNADVRPGHVVEVIGYPTPSVQGPVLTDARLRSLDLKAEFLPSMVDPEQVMTGTFDNRLVSIEARLISQGESAAQQTLVLQAGHAIFNAELDGSVPLGRFREGSILQVIGICAVQRQHRGDRFRGDTHAPVDSFRILLRSIDDVKVVHAAPWWSLRHAWPAIALLTLSVAAAMLWARTLRRRVEAQTTQIEKQSSFLRQIIDMCPGFISVRDRSGRYTLINRALAEEYGQMPDQVLGKSERDLGLPQSEFEMTESSDREVLEVGAEKTLAERTRTTKLGQVQWLRTVKRPILNQEGAATHVLEVSDDITVHKQAEEILDGARSAAEAANRAKSEFLANMSHEIRTPLNGIIGMSELCLDTELTNEQREYVQALKVSGDGLLGVINDILDFSKIEAGKLQLEAHAFDIRDVIDSVARTLALQAHRQGIELLYEIAPNVQRTWIGDANRLRQVFLTLVSDAIKATAKGEVVLSAALIGQTESKSTLQFTIADTSARTAVEVGEQQREAEMSAGGKQPNGSELGLTISQKLIELMGGSMWAESAEGGRCLHFTLCLEASVAQRKPTSQLGQLLLRKARVLIVEDNASQRRILREALARAGMRPTEAASASEGMECLRASLNTHDPYAIALVSYDMPVIGGCTFAGSIRERQIPLPVLMLTRTSSQREGAARCRDLKLEGYLVKPFSEEELTSAIARVLQEREALPVTENQTRANQSATPGGALNVLVAEDNNVNQMVMQRLLHKRGHRVVIAGSGKAALQAVENERFDLVLMDVQMPELDGLEATREIRRRESDGGSRTPIVALTAHAMSGDRERCLAAGMDGYMTKPVNPNDLDETLARYAAR